MGAPFGGSGTKRCTSSLVLRVRESCVAPLGRAGAVVGRRE